MTKIIRKISDWKKLRAEFSKKNLSVGLVPTLGALHKGHEALIKKALSQNEVTVVSIFLNPTQFNLKEDLTKYPKTLKKDLEIISALKVDYLFYPSVKEIYKDSYRYRVIENDYSKILCGKFRPGHFEGVLTIVLKLFNIIKPDKAYFGEKDFQQLQLIKGMVNAFFLDLKIISVPTIREKDGLAFSSRNIRLSKDERILAAEFPKILSSDLSLSQIKNQLKRKGFRVEYVEKIDSRKFAAVYIGNVRLIDNVKL